MKDQIWQRNEVQSPCTKICVIHPEARICVGCNRTGDEIARWTAMSIEERADVMDALPARSGLLQKRRGGRAARTGT